MDDYFDLGSFSRVVTTDSPAAQAWFDRGLSWTYAFNHEEACACFERALDSDPGCAMACWGLAYALGPNYNKPWEFFTEGERELVVVRAHAAARRAAECAGSASVVEQDLISALQLRYPAAAPAADCSVWNLAYADRMREVYARHRADLDVTALFAEALMNLTPWALWDQRTGQPAPGACTTEIKDVLERALATPAGRQHPGILHMYIHLMEMSPQPEEALTAGDLLRDLVPDAGHLLHMPTHLDVLCGDYRRVVSSNSLAISADNRFTARAKAAPFYTLYRAHNYHFKAYGAMFLGQSNTALAAARDLEQAIPEDLLRVEVPPMADWLESFLSIRMHVYVRFGYWDQILATPLPADRDLYCVTTATIRYARGIACAATSQLAESEMERAAFRAALERVPDSRTLFNNTCQDILAIASAMLDGEIAYRTGHIDEAFASLQHSVDLDDNLPYDEPWGWMQPTRHAYGALLLEQGRTAEAEAIYRADLGLDDTLPRACQHPGNIWSLHGYHECLAALGKHDAAAIIGQQLAIARAFTDVPITASCFCRLSNASCC
jgi:tetratricopeptide (TPR) repeat protein